MSEFMLWFIRPFAELLGGLAMLIGFIVAAIFLMAGYALWLAIKEWFKRTFRKGADHAR